MWSSFRPNTQISSSGTVFVILQYMKCILPVDQVEPWPYCVGLWFSTTVEEGHSAVAAVVLSSSTELNVGESFGAELVRAIQSVAHLVTGINGIPSLNRALSWLYHRFYINTFHRGE